MALNPRVFREYDVRGLADRDFPDEVVAALGRALARHWQGAGIAGPAVLGRDCRLSSPRIHAALREALLQAGRDVVDIGVVPTPLVYFSLFHLDVGCGVQITGSHNPGPENGFKVCQGKTTLHGEAVQTLRRLTEEELGRATAPAARRGQLVEKDVIPAYRAEVARRLELGPRRFRVVVDGGNGTGGFVGAPLLRELGFDVVELYCEPDGRFPNHHPDPTQPENVQALIEAVAREGAELGIAYDGDADRLGVVSAGGRIVWGDELMILFARAILAEQPGATFVSEVKCSQVMYDEIERMGGRAIMWKVGHSLIKEKLKASGAQLAGEMSGHLFFAHRYFGYDDAVYASARLCELLSRSDETLDRMLARIPRLTATPELRYDCPDELKFPLVERVRETLRALARDGAPGPLTPTRIIDVDGVRVVYPDGGWGLVRASNTQPVLVMRFEAPSEERLAAIRAEVEALLARERAALG